MSAPTDGLTMPSDAERLKTAPVYVAKPQDSAPLVRGTDGRRLVGPAGFNLEQ